MFKSVKSAFAAAVVTGVLAGSAFAADFASIGTSSAGGGFYLIGNAFSDAADPKNHV